MGDYRSRASFEGIFGTINQRLAALESMPVTVGSGAPTHTAVDGRFYIDKTNVKLYVRVNGAWKSAALT